METRHFILIILLLLLPFTGCKKDDITPNYPSDTIQDEDFKKYLLERFDTNKDGHIDLHEAEAVKEIDCSGNFTSLKGLEIFTNLEKLTLAIFSVADSLDVSKNIKLKELHVHVPLKTLDLSKNVDLEKLSLNGASLENIDISKNTKLQEFYFHAAGVGKSLEKLDVFNNVDLEILVCNYLAAPNLNISQNKKLIINYGDVSYIDIMQNSNLAYFDFSGTKISGDIDIRHTKIDTIICNTLIKSLNAKGLKTLKMVSCISEIPFVDLSESTIEELNYYIRTGYRDNYSTEPATLLLNDCHSLKQFIYEQKQITIGNYDVRNGALTIEAVNCKSLEVFQSNFLASLKINNCPALKDLKCVGTFEEIDL
jgi:hypothetical protein